jgi:hypothetical protein
MQLWTEPLAGDDSIQAALYGPLALAADLGSGPRPDASNRLIHDTFPKEIPAVDPLPSVATKSDADASQWIHVDSTSELRFQADAESAKFNLTPLYQIADQRYAVYWQLRGQNGKKV